MPTKKVEDWAHPCLNPEHTPPTMQVFSPGRYEHQCPSCGHKTVFAVPGVFC